MPAEHDRPDAVRYCVRLLHSAVVLTLACTLVPIPRVGVEVGQRLRQQRPEQGHFAAPARDALVAPLRAREAPGPPARGSVVAALPLGVALPLRLDLHIFALHVTRSFVAPFVVAHAETPSAKRAAICSVRPTRPSTIGRLSTGRVSSAARFGSPSDSPSVSLSISVSPPS